VRGDARASARADDLTVRGEVTLLSPPAVPMNAASEDDIRSAVARLRGEGLHLEIAKRLAKDSGWSARDIYRIGLE
jgi:hypothetical protein